MKNIPVIINNESKYTITDQYTPVQDHTEYNYDIFNTLLNYGESILDTLKEFILGPYKDLCVVGFRYAKGEDDIIGLYKPPFTVNILIYSVLNYIKELFKDNNKVNILEEAKSLLLVSLVHELSHFMQDFDISISDKPSEKIRIECENDINTSILLNKIKRFNILGNEVNWDTDIMKTYLFLDTEDMANNTYKSVISYDNFYKKCISYLISLTDKSDRYNIDFDKLFFVMNNIVLDYFGELFYIKIDGVVQPLNYNIRFISSRLSNTIRIEFGFNASVVIKVTA